MIGTIACLSALALVGANAASLTVSATGALTETGQSVSAPTQTCTLSPMGDAPVRSTAGNSNYWASDLRTETPSPIEYSFLKFALGQNLTGLCSETNATLRSDAAIESVALQLYVMVGPTGSSVTVDAYAAAADWGERKLTYNTRPGIEGSATSATATVGSGYWVNFDVESAVTAWWEGTDTTNYGWRLSISAANRVDFGSREDANIPRLVITYASGERTCTLTAADDTALHLAAPDSSVYGNDTSAIVRPDYAYLDYNVARGLVRFDLTSGSDNARCADTGTPIPPGATVRSASLRFFATNTPEDSDWTHELQRASADWDENSATWNNTSQSVATPSNGVTGSIVNANLYEDVPDQQVFWDVASDVSDFWTGDEDNYGWRIKVDDETEVICCASPSTYYFMSEDGTDANRPKLYVHYTVAPLQAQQTCTLGATADGATTNRVPDDEFGSTTDAWAGRAYVWFGWWTERPWFRFALEESSYAACSGSGETGLPIPAGSTILGAALHLYDENAPNRSPPVDFRAQPAGAAWVESTINWTNSVGMSMAGSEVSAESDVVDGTWLVFDITSHVQDFWDGDLTNHGWRIKAADETISSGNVANAEFSTREHGTAAQRPKLIVTYAPAKTLQTCTIEQPTADTYVSSANATTNYGTVGHLMVSGNTADTQRSYLKYDLAPTGWSQEGLCTETNTPLPADAYPEGAWLDLYDFDAPDTNERTLAVHRVTSTWAESTLDWSPQPSAEASATALSVVSTTTGQHLLWDVTTDVRAFLDGTATNYGWQVKDQSETAGASPDPDMGAEDYESASPVDQRPRLRIRYWTGLSKCTLSADHDSWVNNTATTTNYGTIPTFQATPPFNTQPIRVWRGYMRFPVTGTCAEGGTIPAGVTIRKAYVRLWMVLSPATNSLDYTLQRADTAWTEGAIIWDNQPGVTGSTVSVASGTANNVWTTWDATAHVRGFYDGVYSNNGWRIAANPETATGLGFMPQAVWYSSQGTTTPILVVHYDR